MTYDAKVTLKFDSTWSSTTGGIYDAEILPEQHITFEAPAEDLNATQLFRLFSKFMFSLGYTEKSIASGACYLAFNDCNREDDMKKLMGEYELQDKQTYTDDDYEALQRKVKFLEAENSRLRNPDAVNYTDEELDVMTDDIIYKSWGNLVPGSPEAVANSCKCPVMDNAEMPNDKKWVNGDCPLHGTGKRTPE